MHTGHQEQSGQGIQGDGEDAGTRDVNTDASLQEQPSIAQLQSAADEFQAAFDTALYELEKSRRQADERSARISDLNDSIVALNNALAEQVVRADSKSQAVDALQKQVAEAEGECAALTSKLNEQSRSQEMQLEQVNRLSAQVEELTTEINQHKSAGLQAAEEYAQERSQLGSHIAKLKELYNDACYRLEEAQKEINASKAKLESGSETIVRLNAELDDLRGKFDQQSVAMASQNEKFALQDSEISALQGTVNELLGHREKIESLNRALHESSISENTMHQKIMGEKDSMISALKERLSHGAAGNVQADESAERARLQAGLDAMDARLRDKDREIQMLAGRAASAAELEARVRELSRELTEARAERTQQLAAADAAHSMQEKVNELAAALKQVGAERDELAAQLNEYMRLDRLAVQAADKEQQATQHAPAMDMSLLEIDAPVTAESAPEESVTPDLERAPGMEMSLLETDAPVTAESAPEEGVMPDLVEPVVTQQEAPAEELNFSDVVPVEQPVDVALESPPARMEQQSEHGGVVEAQSQDVVSPADADSGVQAPVSDGVAVMETGSGNETAPVDVQEAAVAEAVSETESSGNNAETVDVAMPDGGNEFGDYIRDILECNRLRLYFQPIPALVADINNCFEVLARFVGQDERLILPGEVFEKAGSAAMSVELDKRIIEAAIIKLAESEIKDMKLFVKLTRQSVTDHDFPVWVMGKLKGHGVKAGRLVFEVDERTMQEELKNMSMLSRALSAMGCLVSIEHYRMESAPECLDQIHVDYLKIDRQLVHAIGTNQEHHGIVGKIMELAVSRGYLTVAEGVERPEDLAKLWEFGVSQAQGYFIYEPSGEVDTEMTGSEDEDKEDDGKATFTHG